MEITKQLVPSMVESSLKKVHHVIVHDGSNKHFNAFKDSVGRVSMSVRLYPKR